MTFEYGFSIFTAAAGAKLKWWVDPAGAMLVASFIIVTWIGTIRSEFLQLCELGASPCLVQEIVLLTTRHSYSCLLKWILSWRRSAPFVRFMMFFKSYNTNSSLSKDLVELSYTLTTVSCSMIEVWLVYFLLI